MDISHLVTRVTQTMATHYAALKGKMTVIAGTMLAHVRATNNPHQVDKDQVGLGLVQNYSPATKDVALEGEVKSALHDS